MLMHVRAYPTLSTLKVIIVYSLFIASHDRMKKSFPFLLLKQHVKDAVRRLWASTRTTPNVLAFESFLILSNVSKLLCDQFLMIPQVQLT